MIKWYKKVVFENYANFNGRARREEFWFYNLGSFIIAIILMIIDNILVSTFGTAVAGILGLIYSSAVLLPGLAVSFRRFHDIGKSGWLCVIMQIFVGISVCGVALLYFSGIRSKWFPVILLLVLVIVIWMFVLFCTEGNRGENKYGPDPKNLLEEIEEIGK